MLRRISLILVLAMLTILVSLSVVSAQADPIKIGVLVDESGPLSTYGFEVDYGFQLGMQYATDGTMEIAGRPVEILIRDNASDPDTAASQARQLIEEEGVEILVGTISSGATVGLQQIALDFDVILMVAAGASPAITSTNFNENTFRVCRNALQDTLAFANYASGNLGQNLLQFAADYEFGRAVAAGNEFVYGSMGFNFVSDTIYAPLETTDFTPYAQQILDLNPDVLLPIWAGGGIVTMNQQFQELGVYYGMTVAAGMTSNDDMAVADPSLVGQVGWIVYHYTFPDNEVNDWMIEQYQEQYDDVPDLFSECAFATAQSLAMALEATEGDSLPSAMIPELEGMVFDGPKGAYGIRPSDHQALAPMYIVQIDNLESDVYDFYTLLEEVDALTIAPPCSLPEGMTDRCENDAEFLDEFTAAMGDM
jgi:branched-chain amino acid transport system substrate-binding protein